VLRQQTGAMSLCHSGRKEISPTAERNWHTNCVGYTVLHLSVPDLLSEAWRGVLLLHVCSNHKCELTKLPYNWHLIIYLRLNAHAAAGA